MVEFDRGEGAHLPFCGPGAAIQMTQISQPAPHRKTAGVMEQVAHADLGGGLGVRDPEPGQVALHRGIQVDLTGLDQLHHRQGCERFG